MAGLAGKLSANFPLGLAIFHSTHLSPSLKCFLVFRDLSCNIMHPKFLGLLKFSSGKSPGRRMRVVSYAGNFNHNGDENLRPEQFYAGVDLRNDHIRLHHGNHVDLQSTGFNQEEDDLNIENDTCMPSEWPCLENTKDVMTWRINASHKKCKEEEEEAEKFGNLANKHFKWDFACYIDRVYMWMQTVLAEKYYEKALDIEPHNAGLVIDYAYFVWKRFKNKEKATMIFQRAVEEFGDDVEVLGSYASFMWEIDEE